MLNGYRPSTPTKVEDLSPAGRTKRLFIASFETLYPELHSSSAAKAWSGLRITLDLEQISDMTKAMARAAVIVNAVRDSRVIGVRG